VRHSKLSLEGRILVDHTASPGLTPEFCRAFGMPVVGEGQKAELPTLTCQHCNTMFIVNSLRTRERSYCQKCDGYICDACDFIARQPDYKHRSFESKVDDILRAADNPRAEEQPNATLSLAHHQTDR
jgi:hypothetical protein